jgi:RND family efflux transporter MFP subunit
MTRRWQVLAGVLVLLALALAARWWMGRTADASRTAPATAVARPIELAPGDVARAERSELTAVLEVSGGLKAVQSAVVKARVAAEVLDLTVREGDRVQAGQLVGHLDATEYKLRQRQADDQANAAQAQLDIADRTLANNKALVDQGFISRTALDTSVSSSAGAQASLQAARAAAELARKSVRDSEIRAPITGLVASRLVQPGERVPIDAKLLEIVDLSRIELEASVAPEDVLALRVGQTARVQVDGLAEPLQARVVRINPSAQTGTRSVMTYLQLTPTAATAGLRQGLFARATVELRRQPALVVPVSALRYDQARPYVLVLDNGKAAARTVGTGARGEVLIEGRSETAVEITEGLQEGAVVLRATVGALREGTALTLAKIPPAAAGPAAIGTAAGALAASAPRP